MLEAAAPSIWAAMNSWFTPTVLFVLLNLVIGTIAITSGIRRAHAHPHEDDSHFRRPDALHTFVRSPSSVLERLKSIGSLYRYRSGEIPFETATVHAPATTATVTAATLVSQGDSQAVEAFETLDEAYEAAASSAHHFARSQSDSHPTAGEIPVKLPAKLKKSASTKSAFAHFEEKETVAALRPATTRHNQPSAGDEEVDAKADVFINRFRQQLKLQRLDSIMRYKEMLTRSR